MLMNEVLKIGGRIQKSMVQNPELFSKDCRIINLIVGAMIMLHMLVET